MLAAVLLGLFGFLIGPLLGIAADRLVERESFDATHRCQRCQADLGGAPALLPFASWRRHCPVEAGHPRWRYPLIDVLTASVLAIAGWRFGFTWQLWPYAAFFLALVVMIVIDIEHHLLIDVLTYPTLFIGAFAVLVLSGPNNYSDGLNPAFIAATIFGLAFWAAHLIYPRGLGLGDVKLIPSLGLFIGWLTTDTLEAVMLMLYMFIGANLVGAVIGLSMRAWTKRQPAERFAHQPDDWEPGEIPMGPFLALATIVTIALTQPASLGG